MITECEGAQRVARMPLTGGEVRKKPKTVDKASEAVHETGNDKLVGGSSQKDPGRLGADGEQQALPQRLAAAKPHLSHVSPNNITQSHDSPSTVGLCLFSTLDT